MSDGAPSMPDIIAETERLILRTIDEGDAAEQYRVLNTPAVMARLGGPKELHEIEAKHAKEMQRQATRGFSYLMLIEKQTGELVGHAGIKLVDNPLANNQGDYEIGWLIREDRWRRGYAHEAANAVLEWAFMRVGAPHVVALTSELNVPSWKLMEKIGMVRREELDFDDPDYPPEDRRTILFGMTREQWEKSL